MNTQGTIYLVGAGPGDPGLITVKGLALLGEVDAVVADTLGHARLLQQTRPEAEIYDIGAFSRGNKTPQTEINQLLVDLAGQGKNVVRLWWGDPFVFGRAGRELAAARQAGLRVELVPGVTSAIAAPAYAGVPVTDWDNTVSFAVVSGFEVPGQPVTANWPALVGVDTLVIMMPLEQLPDITARLLAAGRPADTPALVVMQATLPQQKQVITTLGGLAEAVEQHQIEERAVVVLGRVVNLARELAWFEPQNYPLLGRRVLVTRPVHQAADFMAALRGLGAEPVAFPTIEICPAEDTSPLDSAIGRLESYHWLGLTSVNGVAAFWERLAALGFDSRRLAPVKIAAIGPATAAALARRSITPNLVPAEYTAEGVLAAFDRLGPVTGQRFLLARADIARKTLAQGLVERGAVVDEIPAYRTVPVAGGPRPPAADIVTFTSSSTVHGYVNCLGGQSPAEALRHSRVVCIGPITAATARDLGVPVAAVAATYTMAGILETLQSLDGS
jgi:uroporphyrinogen III methyltransferase/synthase